jgi:hypothetical protein
MNNPTKPRLSDVAKQNTTDRTSKLVSGFMPAPPPAAKPVEEDPSVVPAVTVEPTPEPVAVASEFTQQAVPAESAQTTGQKTSRPKRVAAPTTFVGLITQPMPPGVKCDKPIMVAPSQHQLLRELSFVHNKPMTEILYNLLEGATLPYQREQQKDV